jgi:AAA+ ATPase superfamily predicted ATPase
LKSIHTIIYQNTHWPPTENSLKKKRVSKEGNKKCIEMIEVHQEKCTKLLVQNVEKKQKFLLNQMVQDQFIVGTVIKNTNQEDFSRKD